MRIKQPFFFSFNASTSSSCFLFQSLPLAGGPPAAHSSTMDVERYVTELHALREVLVAAQAEAEAKDAQIQSVRLINLLLAVAVLFSRNCVANCVLLFILYAAGDSELQISISDSPPKKGGEGK